MVNLGELDKRFSDGDTVNLESLRGKRLVKNKATNVKILGDGEITKKLTVSGVRISGSAEQKITSAGGTVTKPESEQ